MPIKKANCRFYDLTISKLFVCLFIERIHAIILEQFLATNVNHLEDKPMNR